MESFKRITILMFNIIILSFFCDSVCSLKLTRPDPGNNVTVMWNTVPTQIKDLNQVVVINERGERIIRCRIFFGQLINGRRCYQQSSRITPFTIPSMIYYNSTINAIGIMITNVSEADAGAYDIQIDKEIICEHQNTIYVFGKPQKPIITSRFHPKVGQLTYITCSAQSQSLPDEYRNQSQMVYTWDIINPADNHFISGDTVEIANVTRQNAEATFTCYAYELGSGLVSDSSDTLTLDVYYMNNLNIHLDLAYTYSSTLLCVASCHPPCVYTWFDSLLNEIAHKDKINISYSGNYTCMAHNLVGELSMTLFLKTQDITLQLKVLTDQSGRSSTVNINIGLGVLVVILLTGSVLLAVLYLRQRQLKNHLPGGDTRLPHTPPVYENTSFDNVGACESANIENYSSLSGEREPSQPAVYDELSHQREQTSRAQMEVYENVT